MNEKVLKQDKSVLFRNIFLIFMVGNVLGVIIEGLFCLILRGSWETHVTFLWGPFNIVYGAGAAFVYVVALKLKNKNFVFNFFAFTILGSMVEWLAGFIQEKMLHSYSWQYGKLAIGKYISIPFSLAWGLLGVLFVKFALPEIEKLLLKIKDERWTKICCVFAVLMAINFVISMVVLARWGNRGLVPIPRNIIEEFIDNKFPSDYLQSRFVEWKMLN